MNTNHNKRLNDFIQEKLLSENQFAGNSLKMQFKENVTINSESSIRCMIY